MPTSMRQNKNVIADSRSSRERRLSGCAFSHLFRFLYLISETARLSHESGKCKAFIETIKKHYARNNLLYKIDAF
jgi:hypothetical protein